MSQVPTTPAAHLRLVIRHEILTTLGRRSFWFTTLLFPLLIMLFALLPQFVARDAASQMESLDPATITGVVGYVDAAGLVAALPPGLPAERWLAFPDQESAQAALAADEIQQFFLIPADYVATGSLQAFARRPSPVGGLAGASIMEYIINFNLLGDAALTLLVMNPAPQIVSRSLAPAATADTQDEFGFVVPFAAMFILFFIITMTAGYMLQSVAKEKENRTVEVLLLSLRPQSLMLGKVLGLGAVALLQMAIWLAGVSLVLGRNSSLPQLPGGFQLSPGFVAFIVLYFLLGYLLYASILGALGALAPNVREGAQFTFLIIVPLLLPFWLNSAFVANPNGGIALIFSLIPFSAPTAMVARLAVTSVPAWQLALSLGGLLATAYLFVQIAARFFRSDTLLSDRALNLRRIAAELRGILPAIRSSTSPRS